MATGQFPLLLFMIARDTGYLAHLLGALIMHVMIRGKYAGGKSMIMQMLAELSLPESVIRVTGASALGLLPIFADEDAPPGDYMVVQDESTVFFTTPSGKLPAQLQGPMRELTSFMTSGMIRRPTIEYGPDGKKHQTTNACEANIAIAGAGDSRKTGGPIEARMVSLFMPPNVPGPRNAMDVMCNGDAANGRNAPEREQIRLTTHTLHSLSFLTAKGEEGGGLPLPESTEFYRTMEAAGQYLSQYYPDQYDKSTRVIDVARSMSAALANMTAVGLAFSRGFRPLDENGVPIPTRPTTADKFDITKFREDVIGFLRVDPDVIVWIVAYVVFYSSHPEGIITLRRLAEWNGYVFLKFLKSQVKNIREHGVPPEVLADYPPPGEGVAPAAAAAPVPEPAIRPLAEVVRELRNYEVHGVWNNATQGGALGGGGGGGRGRRGSGANGGGGGGGKGGAGQKLSATDYDKLTPSQKVVYKFQQAEGPTVLMPTGGRSSTKDEMEKKRKAIFGECAGDEGDAEEKEEDAEEPMAEFAVTYKGEPIDVGDDDKMFYNPNYIFLSGTVSDMAKSVAKNCRGLKMNEVQVADVIVEMMQSSMLVPWLPYVPDERIKVPSAPWQLIC